MRHYLTHLLEGGWNIAIRKAPRGTILRDRERPFQVIPNTWRTWAADPFLIKVDGQIYVFAELYDYIRRRGRIGYSVLINEKWSRWRKIIEEPFHMSYPNIFKLKDEIYMIPETSADHTLKLYRAVTFPNKWAFERNLVENVMFVDTTFFSSEGINYALTTDISDPNDHKDYLLKFDEEFNFISKQVISESKIDYSRSGGNFFFSENNLYRVSQDCSLHYGGGMIFSLFNPSEILNGMQKEELHISPKDIKTSIRRAWTGIHTYNSLENYEVIDVERKHFNVFGIISRLYFKLKVRN